MDCPICKRDHPETDARALSILSATPRRLEKLTSTLSPRNAAARPMRGKWSAKEIVAHLNDGEIIYGMRYRRIAADPGAPLPAFDQEVWAKELQYPKQPLKANLESFVALRKQNLALLKVLPKGVWSQVAAHPEYGTLSLRELVVHLAHHDRSHTSQVERIASALGGNPKKGKSPKKRRKVARKAGRKRSPQPARRRGVAGGRAAGVR
ncbi:MAG: DinB family protein, partial [Vicinamibacteria bacterium]